MRILGIDPGIAIVGYGIIDDNCGKLTVNDFGIISTKKEFSTPERLKQVSDGISSLIEKFRPDAIAIEELFFNNNAKTAITVAEARGVILLTCINNCKNIYEYPSPFFSLPCSLSNCLSKYLRIYSASNKTGDNRLRKSR